ncbi:MAG: hypothetical protein H0W61_17455 [Bacteroidetes bacterium]|nr:hypothetical protein [Bacteroidota bacterium]
MKSKIQLLLLFVVLSAFASGQNNTFSPYSRYGLGEMSPTTFAHNAGMGGACIALKPDSTYPGNIPGYIYINVGNPASYALIRLTSLEVGGNFINSNFSSNDSKIKKWGANFGYGALGFPVRSRGGACFGIMPYSSTGYDLKSSVTEPGIGNVSYLYSGTGGLNKVFLGYGVMPFKMQLTRFRKKHLYVADSLKTLTGGAYKFREGLCKLLSDFSIGANGNYIFGSIDQTSRVVYPNSLLYNNTYRDRKLTMGDFTGNFGMQTGISIDSVRNKDPKATSRKRALKEKVKFTFGYFMGLNNSLKVNYDAVVYNYILNSFGQESVRDTVISNRNQKSTVKLPLEQGFGIGFKKGERISIASDFAITYWKDFKILDASGGLQNSYRAAIGINYVPEKYAAGNGAYIRRINYRFGLNYNSGNIQLKNTMINSYGITAGLGLPVGIGQITSMVNIGVQYGQMGTLSNNLVKDNYWRISFGFTFSDRWFQKFKYD